LPAAGAAEGHSSLSVEEGEEEGWKVSIEGWTGMEVIKENRGRIYGWLKGKCRRAGIGGWGRRVKRRNTMRSLTGAYDFSLGKGAQQ